MENTKLQLQNELDNYISGKSEFIPYYEGMNILSSSLYKKQLNGILKEESDVKYFEMYLDTIIINMHTKVKKYKKSIYFENENIKDIENQGYTIPFYVDESKKIYVLLGILKTS
jgi:hypothetical protein